MKLLFSAIAAGLLAGSVLALVPQRVPAGMIKDAPPPNFVVKVDGHGNVLERINLDERRALRLLNGGSSIQVPSMSAGYDSMYANYGAFPTMSYFVNGTYGVANASMQSYWYGAQVWYPYANDEITLAPGAARKFATHHSVNVVWNTNGNTTVNDLGAPTISCFMGVFTNADFDGDASDAAINDPVFGNGGYFFEWTNLGDGFWNLDIDYTESGLGTALPDGTGSLSVLLAEPGTTPGSIVPAGGLSAALFCYPSISVMGSPGDPVVPGTNPSNSGPLSWYDLNGNWAMNGGATPISGELLNRSVSVGELQLAATLSVDANEIYVEGIAGFQDVTPKVIGAELVAWDTTTNSAIPGGSSDYFISLGSGGEYRLLHPRFDPDGTGPLPQVNTYRVSIKQSHWLRRTSGVVDLSAGTVTGVNLSPIKNGDCNNDNEVGAADFSMLAAAYDSVVGDANYSIMTDLNEDGEVGAADFSILAANYDEVGDDDLTP